MASKYDGLARIIIQNVGGKQNINSITHCITRLRFKLKDESKANTDVLNSTDGVIKVIQANGQYQVVIGNQVAEVYDAVLEVGHLQGDGTVDEDGNAIEDSSTGHKKNVATILIDMISGIMAPTITLLGASGIIKGVLTLLTFFNWMDASSGQYMIWYTVADGFFYFLPVILGYTAAKKFKMNEFTGMALGISLCYPTMVALKSGEALGTLLEGTPFAMSYYTTFFGLPVVFPASGYTSSVIPIVLCCFFAAKLEKWLNNHLSDMIKAFITPVCVLLVMSALTYLIIGPVSGIICSILTIVFEAMFTIPVIGATLGCAIVGGFWQVLVIFGFHWSVIPLGYINLCHRVRPGRCAAGSDPQDPRPENQKDRHSRFHLLHVRHHGTHPLRRQPAQEKALCHRLHCIGHCRRLCGSDGCKAIHRRRPGIVRAARLH